MESSQKYTHDDFGLDEAHNKLDNDGIIDERLKKQSSYTYWVQKNVEQFPQHQNKQVIAPRKIEDPDLIKKINEQNQLNNTGSAWNTAGTWEDKKLKIANVKKDFKKHLVDAAWKCKNGELQAIAIEELTGEGSVIHSRGKRRIGYELEIKIKFRGLGKQEGLECAVKFTEFCDDGSDPEAQLFVTKEEGTDQGTKFKKEWNSQSVTNKVVEKCREILNIIRDEA
ncbi:uncharacterized protein loc101207721 [Stylonychia lemnae]|uniref:Uncharacterized protein loc101207721 n=1 Tax=Stylonychia lemnae TaxID=5949 RepID=A0A078BBP3_STYLE|nr:uncharacterized protein loc101207721 [Stylonychia lemnae]|eukprot:CDW91631.1 uncharacterized protein loc101207721 [Stylonychia lemnae]